jgi:tetratricopeptide (TPR) repeat protein
VADEREYEFKHILIREVAYDRLPKGRRAELHVRFTEWTRALRGGEEELVEIVAYHLEQACRLAREVARSPVPPPVDAAVEALRLAAEKAERREGFPEAERFYLRALDLLADGDAERAIELRLSHGRVLTALGQLPRAHEELLEVAASALSGDRRDIRCAALVALANIDQKQGRADESQRRLMEAQALAAEINDRGLQTRAGYEFAQVRADFHGEIGPAVDDLSRALVIAEELDDRALRIEGHLRLGSVFFNLGELDRAEEQLDRCLSLAAEQGSRRDEARATSWLSLVKYYRGEEEEAERLALQALAWLERTSDSYFQLQNLGALAKYALARGDPELAEKRLRDALPLALEGGGWLVIEMYRYLTQALVCQQRIDEARELVAFAARNVPEEDLFARAALLLAEAAVATARGERSAATASLEEAMRLLEEQQLVIELAETRLAFGRALAAFGETTGALTELERARTAFRRMGARGLLAQADGELTRLASA